MADQAATNEVITKTMAKATRVAIQAMAEAQAQINAKYLRTQGRQSHAETTQL